MKHPLSGIIPPIVTPLRSRDELDLPGLERMVAHLIDGGVDGLFLLGTTGEGPALSNRLKRELVERTCRLVNRRTPVLVGISDASFVESLSLGRFAAEAGADVVVAAPPFYLPPSQEELLCYVQRLVAELPLPLFLYNIPALTKVKFAVETVRRAMDQPRIVGLKDSSGDLAYFRSAAALLPSRADWSLLIGGESLLPEAVAAGGHGGICAGANLFPELFMRFMAACRSRDAGAIEPFRTRLVEMGRVIYGTEGNFVTLIRGVKCALSCLAVCNEVMAEPFQRYGLEERELIQREVNAMLKYENRWEAAGAPSCSSL